MQGQTRGLRIKDSTTVTADLNELKYIIIAVDSLADMIWDVRRYKKQIEFYSSSAILLDSINQVQKNTIEILNDEIRKQKPTFWDRTKFYFGMALGILIVITSNLLVASI